MNESATHCFFLLSVINYFLLLYTQEGLAVTAVPSKDVKDAGIVGSV